MVFAKSNTQRARCAEFRGAHVGAGGWGLGTRTSLIGPATRAHRPLARKGVREGRGREGRRGHARHRVGRERTVAGRERPRWQRAAEAWTPSVGRHRLAPSASGLVLLTLIHLGVVRDDLGQEWEPLHPPWRRRLLLR
eukprot:1863342-Prymnesium_polylepis.1